MEPSKDKLNLHTYSRLSITFCKREFVWKSRESYLFLSKHVKLNDWEPDVWGIKWVWRWIDSVKLMLDYSEMSSATLDFDNLSMRQIWIILLNFSNRLSLANRQKCQHTVNLTHRKTMLKTKWWRGRRRNQFAGWSNIIRKWALTISKGNRWLKKKKRIPWRIAFK